MRILISNDDGVHAEGLQVLFNHLKKLGQVWVVAPMQEKSTTGHSLTLHKPLRILNTKPHFYGVSGSPADCIYLGMKHVLKKRPDLVISGINRGANLGQDVYYSGTVSAAREASFLGIPSMAVSLATEFGCARTESELHYETAAKVVVQIIKKFKMASMPKHTLLNLNVPDMKYSRLRGIRLSKQGFRLYSGSILKRKDHRGKDYFWVGGQYRGFKKDEDSDCYAIDHGYASLTPLKLDTTDVQCVKWLDHLGLGQIRL